MRTPHQHPDASRPPRDRSGRAGTFDPSEGRPRRRRDDFPRPEGFGPDVGGDFPGGPRGRRGGRPDGTGRPDGSGRPDGHHDGHHDHPGHHGHDERFDDRFEGRGPRGHRGGPGGGPGGGPRGRGHRGPGGRGPGGRAGRGDIRAAVLLLLAEQPMHGYQVIQEIGERTSGAWRPSPGAIYPALSLLEDEGLVTITAEGGRKLASLTDDGRTYVTEHADELGTPWQDAADGGVRPARQLRGALQQVAEALRQVARSGSDEQTAQAVALLERTRRELYLILAGPAETPEPQAPAAETPPTPESPTPEA
ncbi:PadR family transcriptional regulator [Oerskovia paurometabola]|uniref:PadR family transcriptional regulator n=1 Tax=Oerskovia paurometabola TaxID=162170 RepID=A0ABW1X7B6_9CELL|nr:PadR family transcriptional regulator [Oerskovia paurometabola]MBM7498571.1 DNA-binding PadR family transcriptional regulator [Oerskovia paurometabola]